MNGYYCKPVATNVGTIVETIGLYNRIHNGFYNGRYDGREGTEAFKMIEILKL